MFLDWAFPGLHVNRKFLKEIMARLLNVTVKHKCKLFNFMDHVFNASTDRYKYNQIQLNN